MSKLWGLAKHDIKDGELVTSDDVCMGKSFAAESDAEKQRTIEHQADTIKGLESAYRGTRSVIRGLNDTINELHAAERKTTSIIDRLNETIKQSEHPERNFEYERRTSLNDRLIKVMDRWKWDSLDKDSKEMAVSGNVRSLVIAAIMEAHKDG